MTIVGVHYAPETTGNAPYTTALAGALASGGWQVRVVTGLPHYPQWRLTDPQYTTGRRWREPGGDGVELVRVRHHIPAHPDLVGRARLESSFFRAARREVRDSRSAVVIAIAPTLGGVAAAVTGLRRRPLGVLIQDLTGNAIGQSGSASGLIGTAVARAEYALFRRATSVAVITPRFGSVLERHGISAQRIRQLPNFSHIDAVPVGRREARRRLGWAEDGILAVHTGNMGMKQGLENVIEAARVAESSRSPVRFVLVGDGNQKDALRTAGQDCRNLVFEEPLSAEDYPYALAAADVLVVNEKPGVREMSLPSKVTSYVVAGRPIVAAVDEGGITRSFLQQHGVALCCPPGDGAALLAAVHASLDPVRAAALVDSAHRLHDALYSRQAAEGRYREFAAELLDG